MGANEVSGAKLVNMMLEATETLVAQGAIEEARSNYQTATQMLREWLFALVSDDEPVRERAMQQPLPAGIDRLYLATEPWMGLFRTARYQDDRGSASSAGQIAVQLFARLADASPRTSDCLEEIGTFLLEQDDPEDRDYGRTCIGQAQRLREYARTARESSP